MIKLVFAETFFRKLKKLRQMGIAGSVYLEVEKKFREAVKKVYVSHNGMLWIRINDRFRVVIRNTTEGYQVINIFEL